MRWEKTGVFRELQVVSYCTAGAQGVGQEQIGVCEGEQGGVACGITILKYLGLILLKKNCTLQ